MKLVSVNLTTFNRAHKLKRCLDSILRQSYQNIEIIIVDDCSTDNTHQIINNYQVKHKRIKYFKHNINKGNAHARNTALEKSSGYYVAFMDDDDEWIDDNKIIKQVKIFENDISNKIGLICTSVRLFNDQKNYHDKLIYKPKNLHSHILSRNGIIYSPTVLTRRDVMLHLKGFDVNLSRGIDSDFYRRCIVQFNYEVVFMQDITTAIHEYGNQRITTNDDLRKKINPFKVLFTKFWFKLLLNPRALYIRVRSIFSLVIRYLKIKFIKN